jgi:hypothetical protein
MAVGDITRDTGMPIPLRGGFMRLTGTIEASSSATAFALLPTTSRLVSVQVVGEDGLSVAEVDLNVNASDSATVGTAKIATNDPTVRTLRYDCIYAGS